MKKSKVKKVVLSIFSVILSIIAILAIIRIIMSNTFIFDYRTRYLVGMYDVNEYEDIDELINEEYVIKFPDFQNSTFHVGKLLAFGSYEKNRAVYTAMTCDMVDFAYEVDERYNSYAKLDYTVEVKKNETLTVKFFGYGYSDDSEPVPLDKTFVYDIKNVSPENPPKLISE